LQRSWRLQILKEFIKPMANQSSLTPFISKKMTIEKFEGLVKNHLVALNECCVAKFQISSIQEGMNIIEKTDI
jgi:hypothetical protein